MVTSKTESCTCVDCKCDPCECKENTGCGKSRTCNSSWCNWGATLRIAIAVGLIVGAFFIGLELGGDNERSGGWGEKRGSYRGGMMHQEDDKMMRHDMMMSSEAKKEAPMSHDPMSMSMADMGKMLAGKTGDELNRAFLEGMIPHHQAAVDMARSLAGSNKPELVRLGADIIAAQTKEIEQMKKWMQDWGYTQTGSTSTGAMNMHMMPDGTMMHN